jgi:hypothetical protein
MEDVLHDGNIAPALQLLPAADHVDAVLRCLLLQAPERRQGRGLCQNLKESFGIVPLHLSFDALKLELFELHGLLKF